MRISDLYDRPVVGEEGSELGVVRDVRLRFFEGGRGGPRIEVVGLVIGPEGLLSEAAHSWGYAEGRADGPALLSRLMAGAVRRSRFVPAEAVRSWAASPLRINGTGEELEPLTKGTS